MATPGKHGTGGSVAKHMHPTKPKPTRKRRGRPRNPSRLLVAAGWVRVAEILGVDGMPEVVAARAAMRSRERLSQSFSGGGVGEPSKAVCSALARAVWAECVRRGLSLALLVAVARAHDHGRTSMNLAIVRVHDACVDAIREGRGDTTRASMLAALLLAATDPPISELPGLVVVTVDHTGRRLSGPERIRRLAKRINSLAARSGVARREEARLVGCMRQIRQEIHAPA